MKRPIRVAYVIDNLSRAGTESQLLALIRKLDRQVISPSLVLLDGDSGDSRALEPVGIPTLRLGIRRLLGLRAALAAGRLYQHWRTVRPDVVQAYFMDSAYFALPIAKVAGVRKVLRVRNNLGYWLTRRHRILGRLWRPWVDAVLTNTAAGRDQLVGVEGYAPDRVDVIENGVDLDRFPISDRSIPPKNTSERVVGCVANLRTVKNIDGLMRVARRVIADVPDVRFEVAGEGEDRAALERYHQELQLGDRFRLLGGIADVPAFLRSVDVAVLPSHSEGMSNALLEYMASARPIVATDVGANGVLIQHQEHGFLTPPRNEEALAGAITTLLNDSTLSSRLGSAARKRVEEKYSRAAMCRRFEAFYLDLVHQL